jgi:hypothetical protein
MVKIQNIAMNDWIAMDLAKELYGMQIILGQFISVRVEARFEHRRDKQGQKGTETGVAYVRMQDNSKHWYLLQPYDNRWVEGDEFHDTNLQDKNRTRPTWKCRAYGFTDEQTNHDEWVKRSDGYCQ